MTVTIREPRSDDAEAMARVMAAVADEGTIATEPRVDVESRAARFRDHYRRRDDSLRSALVMAPFTSG